MKVIFKHNKNSILTLESAMVKEYCSAHDIPFEFITKITKYEEDVVPVGYIDFILNHMEFSIEPNYYPKFMNRYFKRLIWRATKWPLSPVFIKPADRFKRFTGFCTSGTYSGKKKGPFWCSEIIKVFDEWRYYISDGKVVAGWWYESGDGIEKPAPEFPNDIIIPDHWYGSIDMANSDRGFVLIEAHYPFSVGWYGPRSDYEIYGKFCIEGYKWVLKEKKNEYKY